MFHQSCVINSGRRHSGCKEMTLIYHINDNEHLCYETASVLIFWSYSLTVVISNTLITVIGSETHGIPSFLGPGATLAEASKLKKCLNIDEFPNFLGVINVIMWAN